MFYKFGKRVIPTGEIYAPTEDPAEYTIPPANYPVQYEPLPPYSWVKTGLQFAFDARLPETYDGTKLYDLAGVNEGIDMTIVPDTNPALVGSEIPPVINNRKIYFKQRQYAYGDHVAWKNVFPNVANGTEQDNFTIMFIGSAAQTNREMRGFEFSWRTAISLFTHWNDNTFVDEPMYNSFRDKALPEGGVAPGDEFTYFGFDGSSDQWDGAGGVIAEKAADLYKGKIGMQGMRFTRLYDNVYRIEWLIDGKPAKSFNPPAGTVTEVVRPLAWEWLDLENQTWEDRIPVINNISAPLADVRPQSLSTNMYGFFGWRSALSDAEIQAIWDDFNNYNPMADGLYEVTDIYNWTDQLQTTESGAGQTNWYFTASQDLTTSLSPRRGIPYKMFLQANDAYTRTYGVFGQTYPGYFLADYKEGEEWAADVWVKSNTVDTEAGLYIFGSDDEGNLTAIRSTFENVGTTWTKLTVLLPTQSANTTKLSVRLNGPRDLFPEGSGSVQEGAGVWLWWDAIRLYRLD